MRPMKTRIVSGSNRRTQYGGVDMEKEKVSLLIWVTLVLVIRESFGAPITKDNDDFLLEDMIFDTLRNGAIAPALKWPNATVYYRIDESFEQIQKDAILTAMNCIRDVSCIQFYEANENTTDYVNIIPSETGACSSMLGYRGGVQILQFAKERKKCFNPIIISHELLHTLGFYHEHMSWMRDDYVTINWDNIVPGKEIFFHKLNNKTVSDYGYGYDYDSIMHYGPLSFTLNNLPTITPHDSNAKIGQRQNLSPKDIGKLNAMYNCPIKGQEMGSQEMVGGEENGESVEYEDLEEEEDADYENKIDGETEEEEDGEGDEEVDYEDEMDEEFVEEEQNTNEIDK
ncbi:seminal metalloprotease 1-like [Musca vetustissima]|uniref:seminal metalloprotease 1-like n=1 Tax=Musca vetustissima TaxID=27455 RepID=UPI002AB70CD1|nr:seminal metalloprotease 1-like [Musca vetustissima]